MAKHLPVGTMANVREPFVLFLIGMRINLISRKAGGVVHGATVAAEEAVRRLSR